MDDRIRAFIANEGWLLVAILTFALTSIAGIAGLGALAGAISVIGWFLLTPILLFWGDEVALLLEDADATGATQTTDTDTESDPLEELKRRYAAGEINETEFEYRLERLVAVDDIPDEAVDTESVDEIRTDSLERDREREREPER
ncbi:SHOCT domain-containing protein [Natrinema versiforme]|uniref:SHOCT domain-containing protein n=1 Tax=Natrinema versiforme JCM 10478 TaxID=1227496 RepID=L9XZG7_9EURY|nr:SHOCT domain-containing protein [Natrinema versiforme]ELY66831.1 hypothetical protein C489_12342 [Natrinema versiforme JCM 10478]